MDDLRSLPVFSKFVKCIEERQLLTKQTNVILGVSGGADSLCMLLLFIAYMPCSNLTVAHMNHGIRGEEANKDEAFVRNLCKQFGLSFVCEHQNIPALAERDGTGIEETARMYRYAFLHRIAEEKNGVIAVAHNRNDRAETVLMNIARGCSVDGLKGISYQNGKIVRPILDCTREETEAVCQYAGFVPVVDSTNLTNDTIRNKVRNQGIPFLDTLFHQNMIDQLLRVSEAAGRDVSFIEQYTEQQLKRLATYTQDNKIVIERSLFKAQDEAIQYRLVRKLLAKVTDSKGAYIYPNGKDVTGDCIRRIVLHICGGQSGRKVEGGRGVLCLNEHNQSVLFSKCSTEAVISSRHHLTVQTLNRTDEILTEIVRNKKENEEFFDQKEFDQLCEQHKSSVSIRLVRSGDRFRPFGFTGHTSVQKFLIDRKIPVSKRKKIVVVCIGDEILWIPGLRRSEIGRITDHTDKIIKLTIESEALCYGTNK